MEHSRIRSERLKSKALSESPFLSTKVTQGTNQSQGYICASFLNFLPCTPPAMSLPKGELWRWQPACTRGFMVNRITSGFSGKHQVSCQGWMFKRANFWEWRPGQTPNPCGVTIPGLHREWNQYPPLVSLRGWRVLTHGTLNPAWQSKLVDFLVPGPPCWRGQQDSGRAHGVALTQPRFRLLFSNFFLFF